MKKTALDEEIIKDFMPIAEKLLQEGSTSLEVQRIFTNYLGSKKNNFYKDNSPGIRSVGRLMRAAGLLRQMESKSNADSTVESIFFDILIKHEINFIFQRKIGPYRVDFLINDYLVLELDGPTHDIKKAQDKRRDAYLRKLGYEVMRVPVLVVQVAPNAVIDEIKERINA